MTKDLRQLQMRESEVLLEAAQLKKKQNELEVEMVKERKRREKESYESDRKKARVEEGRAEMLYLLCKKEYMSKFGMEYQLNDNADHLACIRMKKKFY